MFQSHTFWGRVARLPLKTLKGFLEVLLVTVLDFLDTREASCFPPQSPYCRYKHNIPHLEGVDVAEELAKLLNFFKEFMVLAAGNSPLLQLATWLQDALDKPNCSQARTSMCLLTKSFMEWVPCPQDWVSCQNHCKIWSNKPIYKFWDLKDLKTIWRFYC